MERILVIMVGFKVVMMQCKCHLQQYQKRRRYKQQSASCRAFLHGFALECRILRRTT
jgi:hypothetical protein